MARHQYVPQFLLRRWAIQGRFVGHYFESAASKVIVNTKATAASACQIRNLNAYIGDEIDQAAL
jgi:hypothetical protein